MPLDHYVSQVHLNNFCSPEMEGMINAIRKSNLKRFPTKSKDICRIEDNSTNSYLKDDRAIEDFLKDIEPRYNASLAKIRSNQIDKDSIHAIAGFAAYVLTCSPAAMRINTGAMGDLVKATARVIDLQGQTPNAPPSLGSKSMTELLADGTVKLEIDTKYPQALGISNILHHTSVFGNSPWEILRNSHDDSPFFTSDFPAAIDVTSSTPVINRILPLAPDLAIRIRPDLRLSGAEPDLAFPRFSCTWRKLKRGEVVGLNRLIVRCAEDLVLFRDDWEWVVNFVMKNRNFHIEPVSRTAALGSGEILHPTQRIVARNAGANTARES